MKLLVILPLALALRAQTSLSIVKETATQAILQYTCANTSAATIEVSRSPTYAPVVLDFDATVFSGADLDTNHEITGAGTAGVRIMRAGLRTSNLGLDGKWHSRALAEEKTYYVRVSGCGAVSPATESFITGTPGGIVPEDPPSDAAAPGQLALPEFDFSDLTKPVVEPRTGMEIYSADPSGWSTAQFIDLTANWRAGGTNWTNLGNIGSYGTAVATATTTDQLTVLVDTLAYSDGYFVSGGYWPYNNFNDICVDSYGSGTDATAGNRTVRYRLSLDSGQTAFTNAVNVILPQTTNGATGLAPTGCPQAYFRGWGKALPRSAWPRRGSATVTAGLLVLTKDAEGTAIGVNFHSVTTYLDTASPAGTKIFVNGSAGSCVNSFCTYAASPTDSTHVQLVEVFTQAENTFRTAALALMIDKTNATGSINLSIRFKLAKSVGHDIWTAGCAILPVTSSDGITGYPCIHPSVRQEFGGLYFIGTSTPIVRFISPFAHADTHCTNSAPDCPTGAASLFGPKVAVFDVANSSKMYVASVTQSGNPGLFAVTYSGTWLAYNQPYVSTSVAPPSTNELSWTNLTPAAGGMDPRSQILANTSYTEAEFGPLATTLGTSGLTADKFIYYSNFSGAQDAACWIFAFTAPTGQFYRAWRTDDGSSNDSYHYAGCHAITPLNDSTVASLLLTNDNLGYDHNANVVPNPAILLWGPFNGTITAVKKAGVFNTMDTSLGAPGVAGYDNTCPGGLPQFLVDRGATPGSNQCVQVRGLQPCSATPHTGEAANHPCPWNGARSWLGSLKLGDFIKDTAGIGVNDSEGFSVGSIADLGGGAFEATLVRNANYAYCAYGNLMSTPPRDGAQNIGQVQHANGWAFVAVARDACNSSITVLDLATNVVYPVNQTSVIGHFAYPTTGTRQTEIIGSGDTYSVLYQRSWATLNNAADWTVQASPAFAGYTGGNFSDVQSYIDAKQFNAPPELKKFAFDMRHYNGGTGSELEVPGQGLGLPTNVTPVGGTTHVYKVTYTGTADVKHQALRVWAGIKWLLEKSSATMGNQLTDADDGKFCYVYISGECRSGSMAGELYVSLAGAQTSTVGNMIATLCEASQLNVPVICAMAGPTQGMQSYQVQVDSADPTALRQRFLSSLLMSPNQQYVFSNLLPTPDGKGLLYGGYMLSGYHTGLMMAMLPTFPSDGIARNTFVPQSVPVTSVSGYVEFGYEEFGTKTQLRCTARQESCRVAATSINESNPFSFASESLTPVSGTATVLVPSLPGHLLYYRIVDNGTPGVLSAAMPDGSSGPAPPAAPSRLKFTGPVHFTGRISVH